MPRRPICVPGFPPSPLWGVFPIGIFWLFSFLVFWFSCGAQAQVGRGRILEKIYAVVNGSLITLTDLESYREKLKKGLFVDELIFDTPEKREKSLRDSQYLLKLLVDQQIVDGEIKRSGFVITPAQLTKELTDMAGRQNMSLSQMKKAIVEQGISFADYESFVKKRLETRQLLEREITSKIKISEQDIVSHYLSQNRNHLAQVYEYDLDHILFDPKEKKQALEILDQVKKGGDFLALAEKHSKDSDVKDNGGYFGRFKSGEMIDSIAKAIRPLKPGQVTGLVTSPLGLHIFKVKNKKFVRDPDIEKARPRIYQELMAQSFKEQFDFWLSKKRKEATIHLSSM